jgi:hypothetical protein
MTRFIRPVCALAALALAGCTTYYDPPPASTMRTTDGAPVVSASAAPVATAVPAGAASAGASAYRPGFGTIESIALVSLPAAASAGGTLPPVVTGPYRVTMRMDDGAVQTIVVDNRAFLVGDRVQVMPDGRLVRA